MPSAVHSCLCIHLQDLLFLHVETPAPRRCGLLSTALLTCFPSQILPSAYPRATTHIFRAFTQLKRLFTTACVLSHPDPTMQFIVEVDASNSGMGAVLSQRTPGDQKLHPCAFFSRRLSPVECNYDVGNREL